MAALTPGQRMLAMAEVSAFQPRTAARGLSAALSRPAHRGSQHADVPLHRGLEGQGLMSETTRLRRRRCSSCLASSSRKIDKAIGLGVDSIVIDLEDGVAFSQKAEGATNSGTGATNAGLWP